jgi:hypothetical protein
MSTLLSPSLHGTMARTKKLLSPLPRACSMKRGQITENKKLDPVDYVGSSEGCNSHLASFTFYAYSVYEDIEDLHSYEKNKNTRNYGRISKKKSAISRYSLVPFFFISREHLKFYLSDKILRMLFSIFKTTLSSYFLKDFNQN